MDDGEFVKSMHEGGIEGGSLRRRPPVNWINRVDEYWRDTKLVDWGLRVREALTRTGKTEDISAVATPTEEFP